MIVSLTISEAWDSAIDIVALQSNPPASSSFFYSSYLNQFLNAEILFAETPSPFSSPSQVAEELEVPQARPISGRRKKLVGNSSLL